MKPRIKSNTSARVGQTLTRRAGRHAGRGGFTLMEVLLVILIIGLLAGVAIFAFQGTLFGAREDTTEAKIREIQAALDRYSFDMNAYPDPDEEGLAALTEAPADEELAKNWRGPYVKGQNALKDSWGNDFVYTLREDPDTGKRNPVVYSRGPNGEDDSGEGDDVRLGGDEEEGTL